MNNYATYIMQDQVRQKIPDLMNHTYRNVDRCTRNSLFFGLVLTTFIALNLLADVFIS
jgi:hypothetical protein